MTERRGLALLVAAGLLVVALIGASTTGTLAVFTDTASASGGSTASTAFTSGAIATPATPTVTQVATTGVANVTWTSTAVTTGGGNTTAGSYDVVRYAAPSGGAGTTVCSGVTGTSCTAPKVSGAGYYAVLARFGSSWTREGARRSHTADTTGPTVAISSNVQACSNGVVCGTASDSGGGTVSKVEYWFLRKVVQNGNGNTTYSCWNGSSWVNAAGPSCSWANATGTTSWRVPGNQSTAYAMQGGRTYTYTITAQGTDSFGNEGAEATLSQSP